MVEGEPPLDELVAEPIVRLVMASDGISIDELEHLLEDVRLRLEAKSPIDAAGGRHK